MSDLETLLRELRPVPEPAFAARLDARVAQRFARPPRFAHVRRNFFAFAAVAVPIALVVFVLASHSGSDDASNSGSGSVASEATAPSSAKSADSAGSSTAVAPVSPQVASPGAARAQLHSAQLTISAPNDDVESLSDRALQIVDGLGGYVSNSSVHTTTTHASATLSLAIPASRLQQGLSALSKLGHVTQRSQDTTDVTDQKAALDAAVRDARADRAGLRARLAKATTDKERAHLRALIDRAERRVTARERQVASLSRQVSYADVELTIRGQRPKPAAVAADSGRWTPGDALHDAVRVLEVAFGVLLVALAVALPVGIVAVLIAVAVRLTVRRRRERALEMA
jgi:hypothetical protein